MFLGYSPLFFRAEDCRQANERGFTKWLAAASGIAAFDESFLLEKTPHSTPLLSASNLSAFAIPITPVYASCGQELNARTCLHPHPQSPLHFPKILYKFTVCMFIQGSGHEPAYPYLERR